MAKRADLQTEFENLLGSRNVYFQPPASVSMDYPAIRYKLSDKDQKRANNGTYLLTNQYEGTVITTDPDSEIPDMVLTHFQMCDFGRPYVKDNLHHFPFTLYF